MHILLTLQVVRTAVHTRSFNLALTRNKTFSELDESLRKRERRWRVEQLTKSRRLRTAADAAFLKQAQARRSVQRDRVS